MIFQEFYFQQAVLHWEIMDQKEFWKKWSVFCAEEKRMHATICVTTPVFALHYLIIFNTYICNGLVSLLVTLIITCQFPYKGMT